MATYAIGDVQGCYDSLQRLLAAVRFDAEHDRVWLVGDLVNRGPKSAQVLRWARGLGDRLRAVLGNHDLHLISRFHGVGKQKKRDTLEEVLGAPDAASLVDWLARRPFLHDEGGWLMVHAGVLPFWTLADARALARRAERLLQADPARFFSTVRDRSALRFASAADDDARMATAVVAFTRMRMCEGEGEDLTLSPDFDGPPAEAPPGLVPWFSLPRRMAPPVVFGHWSALGLHLSEGTCGLDTGCVWGRQLTALRLEDRAVFQVEAAEPKSDR